jgi:seryl-tRNA synthetase
MLDIRLIRENPDYVRERLKARTGEAYLKIDEILECDRQRREWETKLQQLNGDRRRLSKEVGMKRAKGESSQEIEDQVRGIGEKITDLTDKTTQAETQQKNLLLQLPNLPYDGNPIGADAAANPVVKVWHEKPTLPFPPLDHVTLGTKLGLFDLERAAKISGSGFICFTGQGARLQRALINFCLDLHTQEHGYTEVRPPYLVRRDVMFGTGQLPKFEEDMYGLENGELFLLPTAEVPVTNLYREEILPLEDLPKNFTAYTPCFRREAGSAGRENRGIIRVHQFDKVELVKVVTPETSFDELEKLTLNAEKVLQLLGLHYRIIELCTGDMGFCATKTYDIEVWAPGQNTYLEVSSCSNCSDFQARRMNLKFKDAEGKNRFCHTLNGSGTAMPRLFVALVETYQQADGSIKIPVPLQRYFGDSEIR